MKRIINLLVSNKVILNMKKLYPAWELEERIEKYYQEKIRLCLTITVCGAFLLIAIACTQRGNITKDGRIIRNDYEKGQKKVTLIMSEEGNEKEHEYEVNISAKRYSTEQIEKMSDEFKEKLIKTILYKNKSADHVTSNLNFAKRIEGYPFDIKYSVGNPSMISIDGIINQKNVVNGSDVLITATITYCDYREEFCFYVCLYEADLTDEELFDNAIKDSLIKNDEQTICDDYFVLPEKVAGKKVMFYEKKNNNYMVIAILILVSIISTYVFKDKELEKEIVKREEILLQEYPRLINKFTLFYNAGMPIKKIWFKVCSDYENESKKKNCLYEEMIITRNQIVDGKSEIEAYEEFAKRINLKGYQVFINLIVQSIVMGKKEFSKSLELECLDAFNERRNKAKRLFEEAGTKLLVPMFMMLFVVVIIIMFPAFYSFKM